MKEKGDRRTKILKDTQRIQQVWLLIFIGHYPLNLKAKRLFNSQTD
jgi:hypothetical protein